ncbi:MAG: trigger factor [Defluviitaleaceae bacterium]|nr:trigger factor [Defluviitaleaceae bacterium]
MSQSVLTQKEENLINISFEIAADEFEKALQQAYNENKNKIHLPGFRKGRVPRKMIEAQYGKNFFYEDALDAVFPDRYEAALDEHDVDPVSRPSITEFKVSDEGVANIVVETWTKPEATLADWKGVEYRKPVTEATDAEVDAELKKEQEASARLVNITDRPAKDGDQVTIDFEGFIDDVPFAGGKGEGFDLTLGSGQFIPGFEEQLIDANIGDDVDVNVSFPEEYHANELAGKPALFKVKVHDIHEKQVPELDDDFAKEVSEHDTIEEYKQEIKERIEDGKRKATDREVEEQLAMGLGERVEVNIPQAMIDTEIERQITDFARMIQQQTGMELNQYLQATGMDNATLRMAYEGSAPKNVRSRLGVEAVIRMENIQVTEEEMDKELDIVAPMYRLTKQQFVEAVGKGGMKNIENDVKAQKALALVREHGKAITAEEAAARKEAEKATEEASVEEEKPKKKATKKSKDEE